MHACTLQTTHTHTEQSSHSIWRCPGAIIAFILCGCTTSNTYNAGRYLFSILFMCYKYFIIHSFTIEWPHSINFIIVFLVVVVVVSLFFSSSDKHGMCNLECMSRRTWKWIFECGTMVHIAGATKRIMHTTQLLTFDDDNCKHIYSGKRVSPLESDQQRSIGPVRSVDTSQHVRFVFI